MKSIKRPTEEDCASCGYKESFDCGRDVSNDAITLLKEQEDALEQMRLDNTDLRNCNAELMKEQEAVEPSFKQDEKGIFVWCCGSCGAYMYHIYDGIDKAKEYAKFCRRCGKPVLWEGR